MKFYIQFDGLSLQEAFEVSYDSFSEAKSDADSLNGDTDEPIHYRIFASDGRIASVKYLNDKGN